MLGLCKQAHANCLSALAVSNFIASTIQWNANAPESGRLGSEVLDLMLVGCAFHFRYQEIPSFFDFLRY
jgi:hypothetical protein